MRPFAAGERPFVQFTYQGGEEIRPVFFISPEASVAGGNRTVPITSIRGTFGTMRTVIS